MVDISYEFEIELTDNQKKELILISESAKKDNGNVIFFFSDNRLKGYVVPDYRVELVNDILDRKNPNAKIKKPKFDSIISRSKLVE